MAGTAAGGRQGTTAPICAAAVGAWRVADGYEGWGIVQYAGAFVLAGRLSPEEQYGTPMIRIEIPDIDAGSATVRHVPVRALTCLTESTETAIRRMLADHERTQRSIRPRGEDTVQ